MKSILIYGAGTNSISLINLIESTKKYKIIGLIGLENEKNKTILKYKVKYTDKDINALKKKYKYIAISNTYYNNLRKRRHLIVKLRKNFKIPSIVSPNAILNNYCSFGEGVQIFNNVVINTQFKVDDFAVINTGSIIEHDVKIAKNVHISTSVTVNGGCVINSDTFIGSGTVIKQNLIIKKNSFIKMMSRLL